MYKYATINPQATTVPEQALGIEVTIPAIAALCSLGNIDPQHSDSGNANVAAIDAAMDWPLPPAGSTLATIRADLDSIGAMAVLLLRAADQAFSLRKVNAISAYDRFAVEPWQAQQPEPDWEIRALNALIGDFRTPLDERVALMADWLCDAVSLADEAAAARDAYASAAAACTITVHGMVALVTSVIPSRTPIDLAYKRTPIVIFHNPEARVNNGPAHRKYSVCVWPGTPINLAALLAALRTYEPGWAGNVASGIIGSTQGMHSPLNEDDVLAIVQLQVLIDNLKRCTSQREAIQEIAAAGIGMESWLAHCLLNESEAMVWDAYRQSL